MSRLRKIAVAKPKKMADLITVAEAALKSKQELPLQVALVK